MAPDADAPARGHRLFGPGSVALVLYGTIAAGLALAIASDTELTTWAVIAAVLAELVGFFSAHAYADMMAEQFEHPGLRLSSRLRHACGKDVVLVVGGMPIVLVFAVERAAGVGVDVGVDVVLALLIALLGVFGTLVARRGRSSWPMALGEGLLAAGLGAGVLALKLALH